MSPSGPGTISAVRIPSRFQAGTCGSAGNLPAEMRRRQYIANVAQDGPLLTVTLEGADFIVINGRGRSFIGFLEVTNAIRFTIGEPSFYYYYYDGNFGIAERIGSVTLLVIGTAMTNAAGGRIAGPLEGSFLDVDEEWRSVRAFQRAVQRYPQLRDGPAVADP